MTLSAELLYPDWTGELIATETFLVELYEKRYTIRMELWTAPRTPRGNNTHVKMFFDGHYFDDINTRYYPQCKNARRFHRFAPKLLRRNENPESFIWRIEKDGRLTRC